MIILTFEKITICNFDQTKKYIMRKIIILFAFMVVNFAIEAQVKTPQASPKVMVNQTVGLTEVDLEYSRPSAKGRVIFGDLVPFGKVWRTGANANTLVTFSDDVMIDGKLLPKGKYSLYTLPKADNWEVYFYKTTDNWGNPEQWEEANIALRANAKPMMLNRNVETFTLGFGNLTNDSAELEISWEKTMVALKFEVPTQKMAAASINKVLAGPSAADFYSAGQYYFQSNGDLNKALEYLNKSVDMTKSGTDVPFWYLRQKSLIQAKLGDKKGAIETAKLSLANATKAKNDDYVKMNSESIAEWSKK
jgi:tetratricopeptide (TPR) repeat protein